MKKKNERSEQSDFTINTSQELRQRVEIFPKGKENLSSKDLEIMSLEEISGALYELDVHRVELEMQNEELRRAQKELDCIRARYFDLYNLAPVGYCSIGEKGQVLEANLTLSRLLGVTRQVLASRKIVFFIFDEDQDIYYLHSKQLFETGDRQECELRMVKKDKMIFWVHLVATRIQNEEGAYISRIMINDITQRKEAEEDRIHQSYHDYLTGLCNRRFYEEQLVKLDTKINLPITLVMADVNGLKLINDSFGHVMGDKLLKKSAEMIKKACRKNDVVARLGGDEFVIILPKTSIYEAEQVIKSIKRNILNEKIGEIKLSISFGSGTKYTQQEKIREIFKNAEDEMYRNKLYESGSIRSKTIDLIMNTLYEKSRREMKHSKRVSKICKEIADKLGFNQDAINQIMIAGLLHDIGKMGIDEEILNKPGKLGPIEWKEIKRHPEIGYRILSSVNEFSEMARYVLEHQERWDGNGYPKGLKGKEISLEARIIAIADAYDAMTGDRTYREALNKEDAMNELISCAGTQFDPKIVKVFVENNLAVL